MEITKGLYKIEDLLFYFMLVDKAENVVIYDKISKESRPSKIRYEKWAETVENVGAEKITPNDNQRESMRDKEKLAIKMLFLGWL